MSATPRLDADTVRASANSRWVDLIFPAEPS